MSNLKSKFLGSLLGLAIGDCLGVGYWRYTDDTAMMIALAEAIIEGKGFSGDIAAEKFVQAYFQEPWRGYAPGPPMIFKMIREGRKWNENLDRYIYPQGSFGNGAAMRVAPLGLFYFDNPEKLREVVYESSKITHSHPLALEGAFLQAYAVSLAVKDEPEFLKNLKNVARIDIYKKKLDAIEILLEKNERQKEVVRVLGNGVEAFNSVPTAIYSFLANRNFQETLLYATSLGGDSDTIGAMAGAIAGAKYGVESIPGSWLDRLERCEYIKTIAERLFEIKRESLNRFF